MARGAEQPFVGLRDRGSAVNDFVTRGAAALSGVLFSAGFVAALGGAIQWARFDAADLPADQAVAALAREELVVVGAVSLVVYLVVGGLVVFAAYLADSKGNPCTATWIIVVGAVLAGSALTAALTPVSWLAWASLTAVGAALGALVLGVAARTDRFAWFGCALFVSVALFGGLATYLTSRAEPQVQVAAVLRGTNDRGLFGLYVARNDQRLYLGRPGEDAVYVYPCKDITALAIGSLRTLDDPPVPPASYETIAEEGTRLRLVLLEARSRAQGEEPPEAGAAKPQKRTARGGPVIPVPSSPPIC